MKKTLLSILTICLLGTMNSKAQTVLFQQNFDSSTTIGDYEDGSGVANKFTKISSTTGNNPISAANNTVRFTKIANNSGYFVRNANLAATAAKVLKIELYFQVLSNATAGTTQAQFYVGNGFSNSATNPTGTLTHSKLVFDFGMVNDFSVSTPTAPTGSTAFYNTKRKLTWIINNSGSSISYTAPDGLTSKTLADDQWDLYTSAGASTPELADRSAMATGNANDLQNFYFSFPSGSVNATIELDEITITDLTSVLPINLISFTSKPNFQSVNLNWTTAGEKNNQYFEVLRSADTKSWTKIAQIDGAGDCAEVRNYSFTDYNPLDGLNYYQLKQVDFDGKSTYSKITSVQANLLQQSIAVNNTNDNKLSVSVYAADDSQATISVRNLNGAEIAQTKLKLNKGNNQVSLPFNASKGLYIISLSSNNGQAHSLKFVK